MWVHNGSSGSTRVGSTCVGSTSTTASLRGPPLGGASWVSPAILSTIRAWGWGWSTHGEWREDRARLELGWKFGINCASGWV